MANESSTLGSAKNVRPMDLERQHGADQQPGRHAGQAEAQRVYADLVESLERRQPSALGFRCASP